MAISNPRISAFASEAYALINTLDSYEVEEVSSHNFARLFPGVDLETAEFLFSTGSQERSSISLDSPRGPSAP